jgi:hypothetical protein
MLHEWVSSIYRLAQGPPAFAVYGKGRQERAYSIIQIHATPFRNWDSG